MKTRNIPALVTLSAGFIASIAGIVAGMDTLSYMKMLLLVLFIFYILGSVAKVVIDMNFKEMKEEEGEKTEAAEGESTGGEGESLDSEEMPED